MKSLLFILLKSVQGLRPGSVERIEGVIQAYLFNTVQPQLTLKLHLDVYNNLTKYTLSYTFWTFEEQETKYM